MNKKHFLSINQIISSFFDSNQIISQNESMYIKWNPLTSSVNFNKSP